MDQEERRQRRQKDTKNATIIFVAFLLIVLLLVAGAVFVVGKYVIGDEQGEPRETESGTQATETAPVPVTEISEAPVVPAVDPTIQQAAEIVAGMTLEDKIAQMFVITPDALTGYNGVTAAGDTTKTAYQERPVGGIIYMSDNLTDREQTAAMLDNMQAIARERTGLPLFLCVDEEGGSVARIASTPAFEIENVGDMSAVGESGDPGNAYNAGNTIGMYLAELGFNVDFAPVADVLTNADNTAIGDRSFGSDAQTVASMVTAELDGLSAAGVYGTVKHFPGHGGTTGDSHDGAVTTERTLEELMAEELVPFQSAVDAGVTFVMVGHISVPNVTGDNTPSSLSEMMITDVLRTQMGYDGIVITDAMNMKAITGHYNSDKAAVLAVTAGADVILMPADYTSAHNGLLKAVQDGTITEERIDESVNRIVRAKLLMEQQ